MPSTDQRPPAMFLMGPTASGKTALACALALRFPVELVSVDSALVYRGLDIGSAKPDVATLAHHPHALIDIREPSRPYSAADFRTDALAEMVRITANGRVPLLVGGTGLYFRALERGLSPLPQADPRVRAQLVAEAAAVGWSAMHARLAVHDPVAAERIRPGDTQRLQRALEVIALTGRRLSDLHGALPERLPWRLLKVALVPIDRAPLHQRIARRFDAMLADGFLDEMRVLRSDPALHPDLPSMRAVGYRQAWAHLAGDIDAGTFRDQAIFATRQLAKRQITWLRSEVDAFRFDPEKEGLEERATDLVTQFLPNRLRRAQ